MKNQINKNKYRSQSWNARADFSPLCSFECSIEKAAARPALVRSSPPIIMCSILAARVPALICCHFVKTDFCNFSAAFFTLTVSKVKEVSKINLCEVTRNQ